MNRHRGRCHLAVLVAAALCLVAAHQGICADAARRLHAVEEAVLDLSTPAPAPAEAPEAAAAFSEAKWLPMSMPMPMQMPMQMPAASGLRFPPVVFPLTGGASMPWLPLPGAPHVFTVPSTTAGTGSVGIGGGGGGGGGGFPALVPPYVGATRQEQLSLWASLFNPLQVRPRLPISLGGGVDTATAAERGGGGGVPAAIAGGVKQAVGGGDGATVVDVPGAGAGAGSVQVAGPKWGVILGNIDQRN